MTKTIIKVSLGIAAFLVLVIFVIPNFFSKYTGKTKAEAGASVQQVVIKTIDSKSKDSTVITVSESSSGSHKTDTSDESLHFFYDSKGKSDPMDVPWYHKEAFTPGTSKAPTTVVAINVEERLKGQLSGVVYSEAHPADSLALIGTQIVKVGDNVKIDQLPKVAKVSKIGKDEVILTYEGKTYPVKISGS